MTVLNELGDGPLRCTENETSMEAKLASLQDLILDVLRDRAAAISEYDLMSALAARSAEGFGESAFRNHLSMFQSHFLLFHCLYRLRDRLFFSDSLYLDIHCLSIGLRPCHSNVTTLPQQRDPLRDYYLDFSNLEQTTEEDVESLLNRFWRRYIATDHRLDALRVLELDAPVEFDEIKAQYRRLVMRHHPDRGGSKERLQAVNEAMEQLRAYYA